MARMLDVATERLHRSAEPFRDPFASSTRFSEAEVFYGFRAVLNVAQPARISVGFYASIRRLSTLRLDLQLAG